MAKGKAQEIASLDESLFDKLNKVTEPAQPAAPVVQKVVEVKQSKRENQRQIVSWVDQDLKKRLQVLAVEENTDLTALIIEGAKLLLQSRGIQWPPEK